MQMVFLGLESNLLVSQNLKLHRGKSTHKNKTTIKNNQTKIHNLVRNYKFIFFPNFRFRSLPLSFSFLCMEQEHAQCKVPFVMAARW